jgi:hypothetical protein
VVERCGRGTRQVNGVNDSKNVIYDAIPKAGSRLH